MQRKNDKYIFKTFANTSKGRQQLRVFGKRAVHSIRANKKKEKKKKLICNFVAQLFLIYVSTTVATNEK